MHTIAVKGEGDFGVPNEKRGEGAEFSLLCVCGSVAIVEGGHTCLSFKKEKKSSSRFRCYFSPSNILTFTHNIKKSFASSSNESRMLGLVSMSRKKMTKENTEVCFPYAKTKTIS